MYLNKIFQHIVLFNLFGESVIVLFYFFVKLLYVSL